MTTPSFIDLLNSKSPEFRIGNEARHTVRAAVDRRHTATARRLAFASLAGADWADLHDHADQVAERYLRLFGLLINGYAPDLHEAGSVIDGQAVRVEVWTAYGFTRRVRVQVQGDDVPATSWFGAVRAYADQIAHRVYESLALERAGYAGLRPSRLQSAGW